MLAATSVQTSCLAATSASVSEPRSLACRATPSRSAVSHCWSTPILGSQLIHSPPLCQRQQASQRRFEHSFLREQHIARCAGDAGGAGVPDTPPKTGTPGQPQQSEAVTPGQPQHPEAVTPGQAQHPDDRAAADGSEDAAAFRRAAQAMHDGNSDETLLQELQARTRRLQALEDYSEHMLREDAELDLLECALLIAKHAHPNLDEAQCRHDIEKLSDDVWKALPDDPVPLRIVQAINTTIYTKNGFRGAGEEQYYNPDNSCINMVLATHVGIPITLGLLWWQVAKRCALPVIGLNLPGHFMLAPAADDVEVMIDPYNGGEVLFPQDAAEILAGVLGIKKGLVTMNPEVLKHKAMYAIRPRCFLTRMLTNLQGIYTRGHDAKATLAIVQYLRATAPDKTDHLRDEGLCLAALSRHAEAASCLQLYLTLQPRDPDAARIREYLQKFGV